jgi:D-3-phosphoglycerate dehydrogenase
VTIPVLAYFDEWTDPVKGDLLAAAPADVRRLQLGGDVAHNWAVLEESHGYQALIRTAAATRPGIGDAFLPGAELIARCPRLLAICTAGAGYDVVDVAAATAAGVIVCNNSGPGAEAVAEHALGLMLALAKRITDADRRLRSGSLVSRTQVKGTELLGKTVGIVGFGNIGRRLGELCRLAFGMEILVHDPGLEPEEIARRGATAVALADLLSRSDFVTACCPLTDATAGMFDAAAFGAMKPTAYFVTTARGGVHNELDLHAALGAGEIAGAGVDVFEVEPPPADHPLLQLDNVVATPHVGGITVEATRSIGVATAEQWITLFSAQPPPRLVNPEAWPRYCQRFEHQFGLRPPPLAVGDHG